MVDKNFCMSSYLAFRYIEDSDKDFFVGVHHQNFVPIPKEKRISVKTADDIDYEIRKQIDCFKNKKKGILLSGGMDSAIVASYLSGSEAYTFRFLNGSYQIEELKRAEYYAEYYGLNLHYVDINWDTIENNLDVLMQAKGAPVHSIEPQILQAAIQAQNDGVETMFVGESSDLVFGGMDGLLAKDWSFDEFVDRYIFLKPELVLNEYVDMSYLFERYRTKDGINFLKFMDEIFSIESSGSYQNAFKVGKMDYYDPYSRLIMGDELDLQRVRNGEPKYLIRELMEKKYPEIQVPNKVPMPRPVDEYFKKWEGPKRHEFKCNLKMNEFSGNQKWQMFCLERFLDLFDKTI